MFVLRRGDFILEGNDVDNEVCYTSNTINVGNRTDIDIEVDLHELACESGDYAEVTLIMN